MRLREIFVFRNPKKEGKSMTVLGISGGTGFCGREIVSTAFQKGIRVISFQRTIEEKSDFESFSSRKTPVN